MLMLSKKIYPYQMWYERLKCNTGYEERFQQYKVRSYYTSSVGFPILTQETLEHLSTFLNSFERASYVDLGCGSGFLTRQLQERGVNIFGVDSFEGKYCIRVDDSIESYEERSKEFADVVRGNMLDYILPCYTGYILSWPDYTSDTAAKVANKIHSGQILIYQGEGIYGCCATDEFFEIIEDETKYTRPFEEVERMLNTYHIQFDGIHDNWYIYRRV